MSTPTERGQQQPREKILRAVGRAAQQLLKAGEGGTEAAVRQALAELGPAVGADRAYIFVNSIAADGTVSASQEYSWSAPGAPPVSLGVAQQTAADGYEAQGFRRWLQALSRGEAIHGPVPALPASEQAVLQAAGVRSVTAVPIFVEDRWWGFVGFSDYQHERIWTESELDALRAAAGIIGAAFQRRQAQRKLRQRNRELDLLNRVIAATTSTLEPVPVLETTCRELARAFNIPQAGAALLNPAGTALDIVAQYSELDGHDPVGTQIPLAENEASRFVLEHKQPLFIADVRHDPRMSQVRELMEKRQVISILLLPLLVRGEVVGTIGLDALEPHAFSEEDIALAANVAATAAQVLSKARLLSAEQKSAGRLSDILRLSTELATLRDEDALLNHLVRGLARVAGSVTCTLFLAEPDAREAVMVAQVGLPDGSKGMRVPLDHEELRGVVARQEPLLVADIDRDLPALRQFLRRQDVHAFQLYPLRSEGQIFGFITLAYRRPYEPSLSEVNAFRLLAERAAAALHTVRLLHAVRQQAEHLRALHQLGLAVSSTLEPQKVYDAVVANSAGLIGVDVVNLFLWEAEKEQYLGLASYGTGTDSVRGERHPLHSSKMVPALLERRGALAIDDAATNPLVSPGWRRRFDIGAALVLPLRYRDRFIGFLVCAHSGKPRIWSAAELALAESLAAQAAITVANAHLHAVTIRLLQQSRAQAHTVQQIVDTVPEGLLLLDGEGRIFLANPLAREYLSPLATFGPDNTLRALGEHSLDSLLAPPPAGQRAHELVVGRPKHRIFELSAHHLQTGPQAGNWMLVIHEATAEREQQAYLQAQDRLATVGQLAAGIAHDFNNIMAVITLYAQTLLQREFPEQDRERLSVIYRQAHQASHLISQILDFSRRSVVERRALNLVPFLKELIKMLERTLPETITVRLAHGEGEYAVSGDPTRLQQALINLALNARDAMPAGGTIAFALERYGPRWQPQLPDMEPGDWIRLTVADDGRGIARADLPHIFEPFYTTKEPGEGTGLGLAQVYGIVKQHDGFIDLASDVGRGTTFSIYLPALLLPEPASAPAAIDQPAPAGGETILLVEDDPAMRDALARTLADLNYQVLVAANGEEALARYEEEEAHIDLVLSDLVMPRLGGDALFRALRARHPASPLILFSGYPLGTATRRFVEESGVRWLQKPFSARAIHEAIQEELGR